MNSHEMRMEVKRQVELQFFMTFAWRDKPGKSMKSKVSIVEKKVVSGRCQDG
jgi:hypothetical protein